MSRDNATLLDIANAARLIQTCIQGMTADALVMVSRTRREAAPALPAVTPIVPHLKLTGHPTKTSLVDVQRAGCEFLGFHFPTGSARKSGTLIPLM
jgi:hypothetical protein